MTQKEENTNKAQEILRNVFGYKTFRPLQKEVIDNILQQKDTLVVMPTGGGKSICYQIPAIIFEGLTIVISPLISLMKDQVEQLVDYGINAVMLNSSLDSDVYRDNLDEIRSGRVKLLYLAPETLFLERTQNLLSKVKISCFAVDEAHCISEWGHDFRPEYRQIASLRKIFEKTPVIALTATATPQVQSDIIKNLLFKTDEKFIDSFDRENLFLEVKPKIDAFEQILEFLERFPNQSGIIYCSTRKNVDELSAKLKENKFSVKPYHAGLDNKIRSKNQELFIRDEVQIIVATVAFGMGIDKPNVRFVIHFNLPKNIESYYQQIGRAGRDGLRSHCLLLFSYGDLATIRYFIRDKEQPHKSIAEKHLQQMIRFAETHSCRRKPLLEYFGETYSKTDCSMCDACVKESLPQNDLTVEAQKFLSCVKRTGERFGAIHIIDILRESKSKKLLDFQHDKLSTYGIGKEYSKKQWQYMVNQFQQQDLLVRDEHGSMSLTPSAWEVLRGNANVMGYVEQEKVTKAVKTASKNYDIEYNEEFFEELRFLRRNIAAKQGYPPYVVCNDKSLIDLVRKLPTSKDELLNVHGFGHNKVKKYANQFLPAIQAYLEKHPDKSPDESSEKPKSSPKPKPPVNQKNAKILKSKNKKITWRLQSTKSVPTFKLSCTHIKTAEMFREGKTIERITSLRNIKSKTVIQHLEKSLFEGFALPPNLFRNNIDMENDELAHIVETFDKIGRKSLTPVRTSLQDKYDYDILRLVRLLLNALDLE